MLLKLLTAIVLVCQVAGLRRGPHHPHGQRPVEARHHHYVPTGSNPLSHESHLLHDTKHIEEDAQHLTAEMLAKMSPEELEFHYFSAHDFDHNSKLDGLEMLKAMYHSLDHEGVDEMLSNELNPSNIDSYTNLVDHTLDMDDQDGDGYISYAEYRAARLAAPEIRTRRVLAPEPATVLPPPATMLPPLATVLPPPVPTAI